MGLSVEPQPVDLPPASNGAVADLPTPPHPTTKVMRVLFLNENVGGHAAMHLYLRHALEDVPEIVPTFVDVPPPRLVRKLLAAPVPGLARLDIDLQPLRLQLAQSAHARRLVRRAIADVDVVHVYTQNAALLLADDLRQIPTVVSTDGTNQQNAYTLPYRKATSWTTRTLGLTKRFERRVYDSASLVVAQSKWAAGSIIGDYGVAEDKVRIIQFGLPPGPPPTHVETDLPEITFVGTSMDRKGGWRLLEVFQRGLVGRAVLNLVTHDSVPASEGVRVFNDIRSGDGRLDALLARTALFAFPSEIDKSSWAVMEAMAAGLPAVVGASGGLGEIVEHGVSGLVVDPGDDDGLLRALVALLDDPARRGEMGRQARLRVERDFDARVTTARLVEVLREAVDRFAAR